MITRKRVRSIPAGSDGSNWLAEHILAQAGVYFSEFQGLPVNVRLIRAERRPMSTLFEFEVATSHQEKAVLVKAAPKGKNPNTPVVGEVRSGRPRLVPPFDSKTGYVMEYTALAAIQEHFQALRDPRFGAIRVFELLSSKDALVMERLHQPDLRELLTKAHRFRGAKHSDALILSFHHAGAWLRSFHSIAIGTQQNLRHTHPAEFADFVGELTRYLGKELGAAAFYRSVGSKLEYLTDSALADPLPLGSGHGDYALRNILVDPCAAVTVCDTRGRWQTVIYEDIGYFLASLKYNWAQVYTFGSAFSAATLALCENSFLTGYFDDKEVPHRAVRLYEMMALLDKEAWLVSRLAHHRKRRFSLSAGVRLAVAVRFIERAIRQAMNSSV